MTEKRVFLIALILVVVAVPVLSALDVTKEDLRAVGLQPVKEGTKYIDFELADLSGEMRKLSEWEGKVIFLNFWATWCGPCRSEMPSMEILYNRFKSRGFEIIAVDLAEKPNDVKTFVEEAGYTFPILLDRQGKVGGIYGARSIPTTYVIDRDGTILAGRIGAQEWDGPEVAAFLEKLLAE